MALFDITKVRIAGISACVPKQVIRVEDSVKSADYDYSNFAEKTGINKTPVSENFFLLIWGINFIETAHNCQIPDNIGCALQSLFVRSVTLPPDSPCTENSKHFAIPVSYRWLSHPW